MKKLLGCWLRWTRTHYRILPRITKNKCSFSLCSWAWGWKTEPLDGALHAQHEEGQASKTGLKSTFSPYSPFRNFQPLCNENANTKMKRGLTSHSQIITWKKAFISPLQVSILLTWAGDGNVPVYLVYLGEVKL